MISTKLSTFQLSGHITEVVELVSKAESLSRRLDQQVQSKQRLSSSPSPQSRTRSRSIIALSSPSIKSTTPTANTIPTDSRADINSISRSRSRSRYRSTTEQSAPLSSQQQKSLTTTSEPITFRRRLRSSTTPSPSGTSSRTTTTTSTTTRRPSTSSNSINKATTKKAGPITTTTSSPDDDEEAEYYYYYYDEDETPSNGISSSDSSSADLFDKSQTQRTTGLRTQSFTTGNILDSAAPALKPVQPRVITSAVVQTHGDRGFTKRNLQTQPSSKNQITPTASSPTPSPSSPASVVVARGNSNGNLNLNSNSFNPSLSHIVNHNWSDRAVVPLSEKIKLRPDGTVECLDKGIFPHPISCKQFVHCVTSEENDGSLRAWVYACPKLLTFDPIGGMCNYDEFAYSKRAPAGNACIE